MSRRAILLCTALIASTLAVVGSASPAAADPVGAVTNIPLTNIPAPVSIVTGPDGNLWIADQELRAVVRLTPAGETTTFPVGFPQQIISGGDGNLWFSSSSTSGGWQISRMTTDGVMTSFSDPAFHSVERIAYGPDGNIWFTSAFVDVVGRLTPTGVVTTFSDPTIINPNGITAGPDGALWFTNGGNPAPIEAPDDSIGRITTAGVVTSFPDAALRSPDRIVAGPDGALWFANHTGGLGRVTTSGGFGYYTFTSGIGDHMFVRDVAFDATGRPWFIASFGEIGVLRPNGSIELFTGAEPSIVASPLSITRGPDGAMWFANPGRASVGRITTSGALTFIGDNARAPHGITTDTNGNIWFTNEESTTVSRREASGRVGTFLSDFNRPQAITRGPDARLYYAGRATPFFFFGDPVWPRSGVGRFTTSGVRSILSPIAAGPTGVASGPDGNIWYTTSRGYVSLDNISPSPPLLPGGIVRSNTAGTAQTFFEVTDGDPGAITAGPDGNLWFTIDSVPGRIGRITPAGSVTTFADPTIAVNDDAGIVAGRDGNLWFTNGRSDTIGRITPSGVVTSFSNPTISDPAGIARGPDDNIWFTNAGNDSIGRITAAGVVTSYTGPGVDQPTGITAATDGGLWFTNKGNDSIGRVQALLPNAATMAYPANGAFVGNATFLVAAGGPGVTAIEFHVTGGTLHDTPVATAVNFGPYGWWGAWGTTAVPAGSYQIVAVGTDAAGNRGRSSPHTITIDHTPPNTVIADPAANAVLRGTVPLIAGATDNHGVTKVEYLRNGVVIATAARTWFGWLGIWDTTTVANGTYNLRSKAYDAAGNTNQSNPVPIRIQN